MAIIYKKTGKRPEIDWDAAVLTDEQRALAESVIPLACKLVRRHLSWLHLEPDEVLSLAGEAVSRAAYNLDPSRAGIGANAGWQVLAVVTRFLSQRRRQIKAHAFSTYDQRTVKECRREATFDHEDDWSFGFDLADRRRDPVGSEAAAREGWRDLLARAKDALPEERLWRVLWLRYAEGRTLDQIGAAVGGVTRERARQLVGKALRKVRLALGVAS